MSCRELDLAVEAARAAGALGARMTGGGFGGSAIALVAAGAVEQVAAEVAAAFAGPATPSRCSCRWSPRRALSGWPDVSGGLSCSGRRGGGASGAPS